MVPMAGRGGGRRFALPRCTATCLALLLVGACHPVVARAPEQIAITVDGTPRLVTPWTTLDELRNELGLRPRWGRLLSVTGKVLDRRAGEGAILLNGERTAGATTLSVGDVVTLVAGADRTEPTVRAREDLVGWRVGDPEYTLGRYRSRKIAVMGEISGETESIAFVPRSRPRTPREVALSFDDGPWPGQTLQVLRILRRFHVKATFFMIGEQVYRFPGIARKVRRAGMTIGNHSWDHPVNPPLASLRPDQVASEISQTDDALARSGVHPLLFRPPGGSTDGTVVTLAAESGLRVVDWNVDPKDWLGSPTSGQIVQRVLSAVGPGSIVLMHEGGGNRSATIAALPRIIRGIRKRHLRLVAIPRD